MVAIDPSLPLPSSRINEKHPKMQSKSSSTFLMGVEGPSGGWGGGVERLEEAMAQCALGSATAKSTYRTVFRPPPPKIQRVVF